MNFDYHKICSMLVKPFHEQEAYKNGYIGEDGSCNGTAPEDNPCYTPIHQLVFGIRKMILEKPEGGRLLQQLGLTLNSIPEKIEKKEIKPFLESFNKNLKFAIENDLHCLYEETFLEEYVKKLEEDEAVGSAPTTTTSNVDKLDLPLGQKIIKRKSECQEQPV